MILCLKQCGIVTNVVQNLRVREKLADVRLVDLWYRYAQNEEIPEEIVIEYTANSILDRKRKVTYTRKIELI